MSPAYILPKPFPSSYLQVRTQTDVIGLFERKGPCQGEKCLLLIALASKLVVVRCSLQTLEILVADSTFYCLVQQGWPFTGRLREMHPLQPEEDRRPQSRNLGLTPGPIFVLARLCICKIQALGRVKTVEPLG